MNKSGALEINEWYVASIDRSKVLTNDNIEQAFDFLSGDAQAIRGEDLADLFSKEREGSEIAASFVPRDFTLAEL